MLTIDEAIKHCEEVAEKKEATAKSNIIEIEETEAEVILRLYDADEYESCMKCASEHRQLAEWLKELKQLREFAHYVAYSITAEEEEFNENPRFFGESYCRKLHKLGIIKMVDNKWVYDEEVSTDEEGSDNE